MRSLVTVAGALGMALAAGLLAGTAPAQSQTKPLVISLTGEAEGPGLGDPDGSGTAELRIDAAKGELCYVIRVADIEPARLAHIHKAPAGKAGGPIVFMFEPPTSGMSEGCQSIAPALAAELLSTPAEFYVNIHNPQYPGGAIRGQLG